MRSELWGGAFSAEVPADWEVVELDDVVEIELPGAAVQFSVYSRQTDAPAEQGEALWFVEEFLAGLDGQPAQQPVEWETEEGFAAFGGLIEPAEEGRRRWDVGARVSRHRAVVYSYNDDGVQDGTRDRARAVFESVVVA